MLDTLVYPVWGLIYFRFLDILVRFVRIKLTDRIKKSGDLRQPKCSEKAHTQNLGVSMFVPFFVLDESHLRVRTYLARMVSGCPALYQNSVKIVSNSM